MGRDPICRRCDLPLSRHSRGFPDLCPIIATFAPVPAPAEGAAAEADRLAAWYEREARRMERWELSAREWAECDEPDAAKWLRVAEDDASRAEQYRATATLLRRLSPSPVSSRPPQPERQHDG